MAIRTYQPELGTDIAQGISNLGSLFALPTPAALTAQSTIAKTQADTAAQATARANIAAGNGTAADFASLGVSDPAVQAGIADLYRTYKQHPDMPITAFDTPRYILGGDGSKTIAGMQMQPLDENHTRMLPPAIAGALGVPATQHGVIALGDSKMLPGSGAQPIMQDPTAGDDPEKAPKYGVVSEDQFGNKQYGYPQKYDPNNPNPQMGPAAGSSLLSLLSKPPASTPPNPGNPLLALLRNAPPAAPGAGQPSGGPASGAPTAAPGPASGGTSDPLLSLLQSGMTPSTPFTPATPSAAPSAASSPGSAAPATGQSASSQPSDVMNTHGDDFLSQLPPDVAGQVRAIGEGRAPYPSGMLLKTPYGQKLATFVTQAYPSFETGNPGARIRVRNEFTSGGPNTPAGSITAGNTAIQHLGELSDAADALGNTSYPVVNGVVNMAKTQTGGVPLTQFNNALNAFIEEKTKFYRGIGGNEADLQRDLASLNPNQSPDQLRAAIKTQVDLMNGKIGELQTRWHTGMGPEMPDFPIVSPKSQAVLDRITQRASNVPGLVQPSGAPTPAAAAAPPTQQSSVAAGPGGSSQAAASSAGSPSTPPAGAQPSAAPQQGGAQATIAAAKAAIARGAPRDAVIQRLQQNGIDISGAGI